MTREGHPAARRGGAATPLVVALCFTLSGASALIFQTVWTQQLTLVFGASELAIVAVLTAFMVGLAAGATLGIRLADRARRPLVAYAVLEAAIGLYAAALPYLIDVASRAQRLAFTRDELAPEVDPFRFAFAFVAATLLLLPPTVCMGITLPLLVRHSTAGLDELARSVGSLYALNTAGAAAGAILTAFVLLPRLGLGAASLVAIGVNFAVAALAGAAARAAPRRSPGADAIERPADAGEGARDSRWPLAGAAFAGAVSMSTEIYWTRLLTYALGGSIYAFATMLAAFLAAIAIGSAAASRLASTRDRAESLLSWAILLGSVGLVLTLRAADHLPDWAWLPGPGSGSAWRLLAIAFALMLPSATAFGACFVFATRAHAGSVERAGGAAARVLVWNTVGAVVGVVCTGLWLLPKLGFAGLVQLFSSIGLAVAIAIAIRRRGFFSAGALTGVAALGLLVLFAPATPENLLRSAPMALPADSTFDSGEEVRERPRARPRPNGRIEWLEVGRSATVALHRDGSELRLVSNGLPESAVQPPGSRVARYAIARWLTLLPTLLRPEARTMMVIGLGAGHSVEEVSPAIASIDVVELEPAVLAANRSVATQRRRNPLADPRVRVHLDDARSALNLSRARFDIIVSQPSHPWTAGSSSLFTGEFFALAKGRLEAGGVFVQWIGSEFIDDRLTRSLFATLAAAFDHVECYRPFSSGALIFVASDRPLALDAGAGRALERDATLWRSLGVTTVEDLWLARAVDDAGARKLAATGEVSTDRRNLLQTLSPRVLAGTSHGMQIGELIAPVDAIRGFPAGLDGPYAVRTLVQQRAPRRALVLAVSLKDDAQREAAFSYLDHQGMRTASPKQPAGPGAAPATEVLALELQQRRREIGAALEDDAQLASYVERDPAAAALVEGWTAAGDGLASDWRSIDTRLAATAALHPLRRATLRARTDLRLRFGAAEDAAAALDWVDFLLASRATPEDLLLRARVALAAGMPEGAIASIDELSRMPLRDTPGLVVAREALTLLAAIPPATNPGARDSVARSIGDIRRALVARSRP